MTAAELLTQLKAVGVEIRAADDSLLCRPRPAVSDELRREIAAHKAELLALLTRPRAPECPDCGLVDYRPLGGGWRRCWACGRRWGPAGTPDPGDPPDLADVAALLGLDGRRRRAARR